MRLAAAVAVSVLCFLPASASRSASGGLVAAYGFDEPSGSTVVDSSGNGNNGSLLGATRADSGVFGGALSFDGSARVVVPDSTSLHLSDAMTLEAWVKPAEVPNTWRDVVYKGDDNYYLESSSDRQSRAAGAAMFDGTRGRVFAPSPLPVDSWTYLAVTYDGAMLRLFLNGDEVAEAPQTGTIASSTHPLELGGDEVYGQYFDGQIDEVRVYDVARTAAEIRSDMSTPIGSGSAPDTTPPSAPGALTATAASATRVDLSWGAASDDGGVASYEIERCQGAGCSDFTSLGGSTTTGYSDTTADPDTSYSYRVRAIDTAGNPGPYSNTASASTPAAPSGLVAAYAFDEGSGTTVSDVSGNGHTGTITNATWAAAGKFGQALRFNGSNAVVTIPDATDLRLSSAMTLEAWVNPSSVTGAWRDVVYKGDDNYLLEATSQPIGPPVAGVVAGGSHGEAHGPDVLPTDTWSFLAATYDGSTVRLYVDGNQVASTAHTGMIASSTHPLQIGGDEVYGQYFDGLIDNVRVYDFARTAAEIQTDQSTPVSPPPVDDTPPSAPGTLAATASSPTRVDLSWGAAGDDTGVASYEVDRCEGAACSDFTSLAGSTATSYSDTSASPDTTYSYRVRAIDTAGNPGPYSNTASATTPTGTTTTGPGPLHVDQTGRYLVDENGTPFLMTGDSPQALIGNLTESDAASFFSTRKAQGFNTVWINLLCNDYTGCRSDGSTWDGIAPFTTPGDLSTPNEAYFSRVDQMLQLAAQNGFVVLLDPAETGGWLSTMVSNGVAKDRAYGQYLGRRYSGFSNIIWMSGNDYQSWGPGNDPYVTAVAQGIRDTDPSALQTVELNCCISGSLDDPVWGPLIDLNASYTYDPTYVELLNDYGRSNFLPTFLVEAGYEGEQNTSTVPFGSPKQMRRQEYWSLLSGATGQLFGNHTTWQFLCSQRDASGNCLGGWKDEMGSPGAAQMKNVVALFGSRPWYRLVPDRNDKLVTSGNGSFGGLDYVTAAETPDGKLAIAYVPSARTISVDLSTLSSPVTARWYDPTNGAYTAIGGGPLPNNGNASFATPGTNAAGDDDWVLVLEAS